MIRFNPGGRTDTGQVRAANEDGLLITERLFAVADGMGGHAGGEVASKMVLDQCANPLEVWDAEHLAALIQEANRQVVNLAAEDPDLHGMGTTLTLLARLDPTDELPDERVAVVNVGDSRTYVFDGEKLEQLTDDHTLVQRLVRSGALTPEQAVDHPQRNVLTRALGIYEDVPVDSWELRVFEGDRFLLCSDGLTGELDDEQITAVLRRLADPQEVADELVRLANESGGHDNITAVVVDIVAGEHRPDDSTGECDRVVAHTEAPEEGVDVDPDDLASVVTEEGLTVALTPESSGMASSSTATSSTASLPGSGPHGQPGHDIASGDRASPDERGLDVDVVPRRLTWRVGVFIAAVLGVLGIGAAAIGFAARNTYFVGADDAGMVVIFRGRPGGILWFDPTVEEQPGITLAEVPEQFRDEVTSGKEFGSLESARSYVENNLESSVRQGGPPVEPGAP